MFKSLRWRLQVWHAVVLLTVLSSFVAIVHRLHWQTRLQQVDAELHRTINLVYSQMRKLVPIPMRRPRRNDNEMGPRQERPEQKQEPVANGFKSNTSGVNAGGANAGGVGTSGVGTSGVGTSGVGTSGVGTSGVGTSGVGTSGDSAGGVNAGSANAGGVGAGTVGPGEPDGEKVVGEKAVKANGPPVRMFRDPTPLPQEFEQLFHGDEDSRLYFIIWGRNGELLQKSELAPPIPYPNLHVKSDGIPIRLPRDRQDKNLCREVVAAFPLPRMPGDFSGTCDMNILVGRSLEKDLAVQKQSGLLLTATGLVILAAGVLGGGWVSSRAIRPIGAMTAAGRKRFPLKNLSQRINVQETDSELGKLAKVLNGTFDRLQSAFVRQSQFTADASHELRTPLSVISTHTELALSRSRSSEEYRSALETCQRASHRMRSLIDALLLLARFESGSTLLKHDRVDLARLVRECVELVEPLATDRNIFDRLSDGVLSRAGR